MQSTYNALNTNVWQAYNQINKKRRSLTAGRCTRQRTTTYGRAGATGALLVAVVAEHRGAQACGACNGGIYNGTGGIRRRAGAKTKAEVQAEEVRLEGVAVGV